MSGAFRERLRAASPPPDGRRFVLVPYDQLTDELGPLAREPAERLGIVLVESSHKASRRPYHVQKLALVLASQRHFALEQAERGVAVRYLFTDEPYGAVLRRAAGELGPLRVMEPAERELRCELAPLVADGLLELLPHEGWLTTRAQFDAAGGPPWRLDRFYRRVRRDTGILMDAGGRPLGGKLSFDAENRKPWRGEPPAPEPPAFEPDAVTREVGELVRRRFGHHPGELRLERVPATRADVERTWSWAVERCLPWFGPYEDAMSTRSTGLFHTRVSPLLNLHRLTPARVVADALALDLPLASREGFVRQVLGWRELVRHVHAATDGFRRVEGAEVPVADEPGDGGYERWTGRAWRRSEPGAGLGGARPSFLGARAPLPRAFWGRPSGLACLDRVVASVWTEAWSHHITRLMVLSNLALLLDVEPRELADWFWVAYADAYDWVVEPNVLGMGTFAAGDLMTTKPYVCGAAYIHRMSDYCGECRFDPKRDCPVTPLYWSFLERHRERLAGNARMAMPLRSAAKRDEASKRRDERVRRRVRERLDRGEEVRPEDVA